MLPSTPSSRRVLVADDDPVIRRLVTTAVEREGFTAVVANDGREAFRILQHDADFKGAIFDIMMPNLKGLDVIGYMRTEKRLMRIPAMMITSDPEIKLMSDSFAAGAVLFLTKPFTQEQLHSALRLLLNNKSNPEKKL